MKKRIYSNMLFLSIAGIVLTALLLATIFYNFFSAQMKEEVRLEARFFAKSLAFEPDQTGYLRSLNLTLQDDRISLINKSGQVIFDSYKERGLENHADRPEFTEALLKGHGEDKRMSSTLHEDTYYYAELLADDTVLRIAKTTKSILNVYLSMLLPVMFVVLMIILLCNFYSRRLTRKIVDPINQMNPDNNSSNVYDELSPFLVTISQQKQQLISQVIALEDRANTIQTIIEDMREGLILLDIDAVILSANQSATSHFDSTPEICTNKNIVELTRRPEILEHVKSALAGDSSDQTLDFGGHIIQVFFNPVRHRESVSGAIVLFLDITEKANAENLRREFTANVSHELKTPLTTISGFSEIIELGIANDDDIREFAKKIRIEAMRTTTLIDDILKLSALDEGSDLNRLTRIDLGLAADQAKISLNRLAAEKDVIIELSGGGFEMQANPNMIEELFINLMENAIKYNNPGGKVTVILSKLDNEVTIEVIDSGIGIPAEHLSRVFERFYRADKSRSKKTGGTGLGLSIVKHIAAYHNGSVAIESEEGNGTTVTVKIPANVI